MSDRIIGIDLGTTNSVVAILEGEEPVVIPNAEGNVRTPSVVHIDKSGRVLVGEMGRRMLATHPERTVFSAKRLIGHYFSELEGALKALPFATEADEDDNILIRVDEKQYQPQQISAMVLEKLKRDAEEYLGEPVTQAIITVPANFDDLQRTATKEAGRLAGLEVLRLVNEPTAAAMAYGLGRGSDGLAAVFDFGGGTFDITLMDITGRTFEVVVSEGDSQLGGDDLDNLLVQLVVDDFFERFGMDLTAEIGTIVRVKDAAEKAKCELSTVRQTTINLPFLTRVDNEPINYERVITRTEFEELAEPMIQRCFDCCERALQAGRTQKRDIKRVILVGGSTRIPLVQQMVEEFFGMPAHRGVNPDEIVALGAATQAGVLAGDLTEVVLLDVAPRSLGVETRDDSYSTIIEKNSTIPIKAAKTFTTTEDDQEMVIVHVLQGEEQNASSNLSLGKFVLKGIQPAKAGVPRIRVTFHINADGILEIGAQDMATGAERQLTITHTFLSEDERRQKSDRKQRRAGATGARRRRRTGPGAGAPKETGVRPSSTAGRRPGGRGDGTDERIGDASTGPSAGAASGPSFGAATASGIRPRMSAGDTGSRTPVPEAGMESSPTQSFALVEDTGASNNPVAMPTTSPVARSSESRRGGAEARKSSGEFAVAESGSKTPGDTEADEPVAGLPASAKAVDPSKRSSTQVDTGRGKSPVAAPRVAGLAAPAGPASRPAPPTDRSNLPTGPQRLAADDSDDMPPGFMQGKAGTGGAAPPPADEAWSPADLVAELRSGEPAASGRGGDGAARPIVRCPADKYPGSLKLAVTFLDAGKVDPSALKTYDAAHEEADRLLDEYPDDPELLRLDAELEFHRGNVDEAFELLRRYRTNPQADVGRAVRLLSVVIEKYPGHLGARGERADAYASQGKYEGAIKDLEFITQRQTQNDDVLRRLEDIYSALLETRYSPGQELKLIKILLRRDRIDEAIKRLQNIIEDPQYRARAQKVLGFCYWQKQMYHPAFLQFRHLELTDEMKDTIYRLAADMEVRGDSAHALEAYEFLREKVRDYRDVSAAVARLQPLVGGGGGAAAGRQAPPQGGRPAAAAGAAGGAPAAGYDALKGSRFIILEELNRGSMGIVFKAKDQTLNEIVALKMLNDYLCTDPLAIERFKREARAAKKLSHQRIVRIHDLFEMNGKTFLSMEFIQGGDLKKHLQAKKKLSMHEAAVIAHQICGALEYAHKRGVIHRDIKPANIIFESYDPVEIKVADFGIAKQLNTDDMTTGSRIMGTPLYMAPEQIEGRQVDARSDIYSLGIMLYEMVSGTAPFCEGNIEYQHIHMEPPPLPAFVEEAMARVIMRAIAKRKEDRFQSAREVAGGLHSMAEQSTS